MRSVIASSEVDVQVCVRCELPPTSLQRGPAPAEVRPARPGGLPLLLPPDGWMGKMMSWVPRDAARWALQVTKSRGRSGGGGGGGGGGKNTRGGQVLSVEHRLPMHVRQLTAVKTSSLPKTYGILI